MKVKISDVDPLDMERIKKIQLSKLTTYIQQSNKKDASFKYLDTEVLLERRKTTRPIIENHSICMACGEIEEYNAYAIAQRAMGVRLIRNCPCGHVITINP